MKAISRKYATRLNLLFGVVNQSGSAIISLAFIPLYLSYLGPEVWGAWLALGSIFMILGTVDLGLAQGILQRISTYLGKEDFKTSSKYCYTAIIILGICSLIIITLGLFAYQVLVPMLKISKFTQELTLSYWYAVIFVIVTIYNNFFIGLQLTVLRSSRVGVNQTVSLFASALLQFYMLTAGYGLISIVLPNVVIYTLSMCINLFASRTFFYHSSFLKLERRIFIDSISIMRDVGLARIFERVRRGSYPTLIAIFTTTDLVVAYTLCQKAAELAFRIINMLRSTIIYPMLNAKFNLSEEKFGHIIMKANRILLYLILIATFTYLTLNELFLGYWVGEEYYLGHEINLMMSFILYFSVLRLYTQDLLILDGKYRYIFWQSILSIFVLIVEIICLAKFGLEMMMLASVIGSSLVVVYSFKPILQRYYKKSLSKKMIFLKSATFQCLVVIFFASVLLFLRETSLATNVTILLIAVMLTARISNFANWVWEFLFDG